MTAMMTPPVPLAAADMLTFESEPRPGGPSGFTLSYVRFHVEDGESFRLDCGQMAMAMHHTGVPLRRDMTPDEAMRLVLAGVALLGVDCIRALEARALELWTRQRDTGRRVGAEELRQIFPHAEDRRNRLSQLLAMRVADAARIATHVPAQRTQEVA